MDVEARSAVLADMLAGADALEEGTPDAGKQRAAAAETVTKPKSGSGEDQAQEVQDEAASAQDSGEEAASGEEASEETPEAESVEASDDEDEAAESDDPKVARALATIHRQEQRAKQAHQARVAELREYETGLQSKLAEVQRWEAFVASGQRDPVALLEHMGVKPEDFERVARRLYMKAKLSGTISDPKLKEQYEKAQRSTELEEKLYETERRLAEMESRLVARDQEERVERVVGAYLAEVTKAVTEATPLVASMIKKNPERTRKELRAIANQIAEETGERPDPTEVIRTLEERRREELAELGIEAPVSTPKAKPTAERKTAKTLRSDMAPSASPKSAFDTREDEIADIRRRMESGQLD